MALRIDTENVDKKCLLRVEGEVDLYSSPDLRDAVTKVIAKAQGPVGVDLAGVSYMDSSGVATLVEGLQLSGKHGVEFSLVAPSHAVSKVLQLSRLDSLFRIRDAH
ncbi:MAG: STAS domain-containing protein [bacterium]|nr:STAS domain-containing protein [bacterium]